MSDYKSPGVYIEESNSFGNSVAPVDTAVPAFVGYTAKAQQQVADDLINVPIRIESLLAYTNYFGGGAQSRLTVKLKAGGVYGSSDVVYELPFQMYHAVLMHFANGGGPLFIVSVGKFTNGLATYPDPGPIKTGVGLLERVPSVTLIYMPDIAGAVDSVGRYEPAVTALDQCGNLKSRFVVMDVPYGNQGEFYDKVIGNNLAFGAAYTPDLFSTISLPIPDNYVQFVKGDNVVDVNRDALVALGTLDKVRTSTDTKVKAIATTAWFSALATATAPYMNAVVHPGGAVMGVICATDRDKGVWTAPANVALAGVSALTTNLTDVQQSDLNVPLNGKSINAIRNFRGLGNLVWGARTMDGNSNDWRYIQVRRTIIYIEQSLKNALERLVFEPNNQNTWATVRTMCESFLNGVWISGGLMGAKPDEAYAVACGLGSTMTSQDILDGVLCVTVIVSVIRPAEFITITLTQNMLSA
ncbi:MAG: phage tail sheath C-terminal domain-containing protein [Bacteroidia bacterium]